MLIHETPKIGPAELDKILRKMLKCFDMFEHTDICSNLEENCQLNFRDSNNKQLHDTRNKKMGFMILLSLLKYFSMFEHVFIMFGAFQIEGCIFSALAKIIEDSGNPCLLTVWGNHNSVVFCKFVAYFQNIFC